MRTILLNSMLMVLILGCSKKKDTNDSPSPPAAQEAPIPSTTVAPSSTAPTPPSTKPSSNPETPVAAMKDELYDINWRTPLGNEPTHYRKKANEAIEAAKKQGVEINEPIPGNCTAQLKASHLTPQGEIQKDVLMNLRYAGVTNLNIFEIPITLKGYSQLTRLPCIDAISVTNVPKFTDVELRSLKDVKALQQLSITQTNNAIKYEVTGAGFKDFSKDNKLFTISFMNANVDDDGVRNVTRFPEMQDLSLYHTKVKGDSLKEVAKMPKLLSLSVKGTPLLVPASSMIPVMRRA